MLVGHTTSAGDLQVYTGYLPKKNLQIMHLQLRIKTFPWVKADPGSSVRVLQVPAGTHRLPVASPSRLVFWSNKARYFEILKR